MTDPERAFFRTIANREPPRRRVRELWCVCGRRAGKDSVASVIAAHAAAFFDSSALLRPGERALVCCLAVDREQAKIILGYIKSYFTTISPLAAMVQRETADGLELTNQVDIVVLTGSFRSVRGRTVLCVIFDEVAFWLSEESARPDVETYRAILPGLATLPGAMLIGISTPYRRAGLLFNRWRRYFGVDSADVLVIQAPSRVMNPTLPQAEIDRAMVDDPPAARAEWGAEWRDDLVTFVDPATVDAAVIPDRTELPPVAGISYCAFVDPSGGSSDSMAMAVAHQAGDLIVVDAIRERQPPFSPDEVTSEFCQLLRRYRLGCVTGDRYGGEWPRERFAAHGVVYKLSELTRSELYLAMLPVLNSGRLELLDHPRLVSQLSALERRVARGGRDSVDHPPGLHDDIANAVAGAVHLAVPAGASLEGWAVREYYRAAAQGVAGEPVRGPEFGYQPAPAEQMRRLRVPGFITTVYGMSGRVYLVTDGLVEVTADDAKPLLLLPEWQGQNLEAVS